MVLTNLASAGQRWGRACPRGGQQRPSALHTRLLHMALSDTFLRECSQWVLLRLGHQMILMGLCGGRFCLLLGI